VFTWPEWAQSFAEVARQNEGTADVPEPEAYWRNWVANLERMMTVKGHGAPDRIDSLQRHGARPSKRRPTASPSSCPRVVKMDV
jgi:hypothetical protein